MIVRYVLIAIACLVFLMFLTLSIKNLTDLKQINKLGENDGSKE